MDQTAYGQTTGTDERESRSMMESLLVYSLADEIEQVQGEDQWRSGDRNSRTLAKAVDFRVMLTVLHDGAVLDEQDGGARASLHVLEGMAVLRLAPAGGELAAEEVEIAAGEVAVVDAGHAWQLRASGDCAVLLTFASPREQTAG